MTEPSFTFRLNKKTLVSFKKTAKNNNRIASQLIRDFMILYIDEKGVDWAEDTLANFNDASKKELSSKFSIKVGEDLVESFKIKAKDNNHTPSKLVRAGIQQYIAHNAKP